MIVSNSRRLGQLIVMTLAVCACSAGSFAQQQQRQGRQAVGQALLDRMHAVVNELKLTDEQKPKIDQIFATAKDDLAKMQAENQDLPAQERGAKAREFAQKLQGDVRAELNDEQKAEFDKRIAEFQQQRGQGQGGGQGGQLRRMRESIESLGLTDEQKPKVEAILKDMEDKVQQARQESQGDQEAMRERSRAIATDTLLQLEQVLTPEQNQKLRETMRANRGQGPDGQGRRRDRQADPAPPANAPANPPATQPAGEKPGAMVPPDQSPGAPPGVPPGTLGRLEVGQAAPDFEIKKLDGTPVQLSSFKDKYLLLVFGSYTSPSFRQRAIPLDDLRKEFGTRVNFIIVYTREAHPPGTWEIDRNRDEEISVADHKDEAERRTVARTAREKLRLGNMTFTIDPMSDATAKAYHAFPNTAAVLIGKDGNVLAYQQWFDAYTMRIALQDALGAKSQAATR